MRVGPPLFLVSKSASGIGAGGVPLIGTGFTVADKQTQPEFIAQFTVFNGQNGHKSFMGQKEIVDPKLHGQRHFLAAKAFKSQRFDPEKKSVGIFEGPALP